MSNEKLSETTRRAFLGTATVATAAASLTAPATSEAQSVQNGKTAGPIKVAQSNTDVPAQLTARAKASDWTKPAAMGLQRARIRRSVDH